MDIEADVKAYWAIGPVLTDDLQAVCSSYLLNIIVIMAVWCQPDVIMDGYGLAIVVQYCDLLTYSLLKA